MRNWNKNGIVVASTDQASVGSDKIADQMFLGTRELSCVRDVHISKTTGAPALDIAASVLLNGKYLGIVVACIYPKDLFKITLDITSLGETGEIYLINKDGYMISPSRLKDDVILKQAVSANSGNHPVRATW